MKPMRIKDDHRALDEIRAQLRVLNGKQIAVGFISDQAESSVVERAHKNEFGAKSPVTPEFRNWLASRGVFLPPSKKFVMIPSRPFMRMAFDANKGDLQKISERSIALVLRMKLTAVDAMGIVAQKHIAHIQQSITDIKEPNNIYWMVKAKGFDNPLINTGRMRQSVNFELQDRTMKSSTPAVVNGGVR